MKVNTTLSALANVFALINAANPGKNFSETNVTLGTPTEVAGAGGRNTEVVVTAIQDAGYEGTHNVAYTRQPLTAGLAIATAKAIAVEVLPADTDAEVLSKLASSFGLLESELIISAVTKAVDENTPGSATLTAKVGSLLYTGSYDADLTTADTDVPLSTALANDQLDGFEPEG